MGDSFDFSGWATKNDLRCSDGRIIRKDAFKHNDGETVALVWNHQHDGPANVIGYALLENRDEGMYAYCSFNNTPNALDAKEAVKHGDIRSLSIYANQLTQMGPEVMHGCIREVSLVLAGANPGAKIDTILAHSDGSDEEAIITMDEPIYLAHSDEDYSDDEYYDETDYDEEGDGEEFDDNEATAEEVFDTLTDTQKELVYDMIDAAVAGEEFEHSGIEDDEDATVEDIFNTLTEKQKLVVYALIGQALEDAKNKKGANNDNESEGGTEMKHNVFEDDEQYYQSATLSHADEEEIINDAKRFGSLKESVLAHTAEYGMDNVDYLFPDAKTIGTTPEFIKRKDDWVATVMDATRHTPFSRVKSIFADITEDEARAKGYIKGKLKKEEVFTLLKRTTSPTTIYKKQKMDRDDVNDITEFDVIAWLKQEMRMMLDEEIARAILVGDGRLSSDNDKIVETSVRPIWTDADLYTIKQAITTTASMSDDDKAKAMIRQAVKARKDYKGTGNPTLFTTEDMLTDMILLEDTTGRKLYNSETELASALRVSKIVTVPVMEGLTRTDSDSKTRTLAGIIVNLTDYNIGADKGGQVNMFDDFDIDYNQQKYLIETRISGALVKPYSAIALEFVPQA